MHGMFSMGSGDDPDKAKNARRFGLYTGIPSMFLAGLGFGYLVGWLLDKKFNTDGIFTGIGIIIGLAASMYTIFKMIIQESKHD